MGRKDLMGGLALLLLHAAACNIQTDDKALETLYKTTLGHLPGDLFVSSVRSVLAKWKDTFRLPLPGHVLEEADAELQRRRDRARAAQTYRTNEPEPDVGERIPKAEIDALMAKVKRSLAFPT